MAREEKDREDLMAEARNLVQRCELRLSGLPLVTAGFRRDGCLSVYFDQDPVYHFDAVGRLRRAFVAGKIYKPERGGLVQLTRMRTPDAVHLVRREMTSEESADWLAEAARSIAALRSRMSAGEYHVVRCVPDDVDVARRLMAFLAGMGERALRLAPGVRATG